MINERQQNPYAAPASRNANAPASTAWYLKWKMTNIFGAAVVCAAISGVFVLVCQIVFDLTMPAARRHLLPIICFAAVKIPIAFVFGASLGRDEFGSCGIRASVFTVCVIFVFTAIWQLNSGVLIPVLFSPCYLLLPAAICWIRRVPIRVGRLIGVGIVSFVCWYVLFMVALFIGTSIEPWLPYHEYSIFASFTISWAMVASFASAFMLEPLPCSPGLASSPDTRII